MMSQNDHDPISQEVHEKNIALSKDLNKWQWVINISIAVLSVVAIGFYYAKQITVSAVFLVPIALLVLASFGLAIYRVRRNRQRREEIIEAYEKQLNKEYEGQLRAFFNGVRLEQGETPENIAKTSVFDKTLREIEQKTKAEEARQRAARPGFNLPKPPKKGGTK
jgi:ABC-type multidrug transport system fused ATPase/permease subunit